MLLDKLPDCDIVHADKGYDSDALRRKIEARGAASNIPPKTNRIWKNCFSPVLYRARNAIDIDQAWRLSRISGGSRSAAFWAWRQTAPGRWGFADCLQRGDGLRIGEQQFVALATVGAAA
jgi:hypothetical protein